jgi:hypothetical protein
VKFSRAPHNLVTKIESYQEAKPWEVCKCSCCQWTYPNLFYNIGGVVITLGVLICFIVKPAVKPIARKMKSYVLCFNSVDNFTSIKGGERVRRKWEKFWSPHTNPMGLSTKTVHSLPHSKAVKPKLNQTRRLARNQKKHDWALMCTSCDKTNYNKLHIEKLQLPLIKVTHLPMRAFNNADFPTLVGPKTKHWRTTRWERCLFLSCFRRRVIRKAKVRSPGYPIYIRCAKLFCGSRSVMKAHWHKFTNFWLRKTWTQNKLFAVTPHISCRFTQYGHLWDTTHNIHQWDSWYIDADSNKRVRGCVDKPEIKIHSKLSPQQHLSPLNFCTLAPPRDCQHNYKITTYDFWNGTELRETGPGQNTDINAKTSHIRQKLQGSMQEATSIKPVWGNDGNWHTQRQAAPIHNEQVNLTWRGLLRIAPPTLASGVHHPGLICPTNWETI